MVSSFPTTTYPVKGLSCPGTMVKRSAFVMSSFARGACVWATLTPAKDNERIRTNRAFVSVFILNRKFLLPLKTAPYYIRLVCSRYYKSDFHREPSRRSALPTSTGQICPQAEGELVKAELQ